jgi:citrate lyase subunit beta/citryl-CoA lyase
MSDDPFIMRSSLFVPGSRPELFGKALASEADALIFDLEDAVAPERKPEARQTVGEYLANLKDTQGKVITVRVNPVVSEYFADDVAAVVCPQLDAINFPKVESAEEVCQGVAAIEAAEQARGMSKQVRVFANLETAASLRRAHEIACADPRMAALKFGLADLFAPLGIERHEAALGPIRLATRLAASEAGIPAYDTVFVDIEDTEGFEADAHAGRRMGLVGKTCIHPTQVPIANRVFTPGKQEIAHAQAVVAAMEDPANSGKGAFVVNGQMVDEPFFIQARATVAMARRLGLIEG